jgi:hypothetical protein
MRSRKRHMLASASLNLWGALMLPIPLMARDEAEQYDLSIYFTRLRPRYDAGW